VYDGNRQAPAVVSVVIVNYRVPEYLRETLRSVYQAEGGAQAEIIIVDNASGDNSQELITGEFPAVRWIQLKHNIGFGKACNVGVQNAGGTYILLLNPDTMISRNTLSVAVAFLDAHPEVGMLGPKILNPDGTLQASCKRGFPTPANSFYHFSGLSRVFPESKRFGRYNLTYLDPDKPAEVDAVSGSCMFVPRALYKQIGGFDERFFMYGEDLDMCYRIRESGRQVWYYPETQIIHRKGKSSAKSIFRARIAFYEAMMLFSRKYRGIHGGIFPSWSIYFGILTLSALNIGVNLVRHFITVILDLSIINVVLFAAIVLRFSPESNPYHTLGLLSMFGIHALLSFSFVAMFAYNGLYARRAVPVAVTLFAGLLATSVFSAGIYFVKQLALSRIAFAVASVIISFLLVLWRVLAAQLPGKLRRPALAYDRTVLVGNGPLIDRIIDTIEKSRTGTIAGIIWNNGAERPGDYAGYPVLGVLDELSTLLPRLRIDTLIIATHQPWYSHIIEVLSSAKVRNLTIKWAPHDLAQLDADKLPAEIPLRDFSV
jgi:GT2 family glycosyltransferase